MIALNSQLNFETFREVVTGVASEVTSIIQESTVAELIHSLLNPMTDSMVSYGITATGVTIATIAIEWSTRPSRERKKTARKSFGSKVKLQEFSLKGRVGQTIGKVKMNKNQSIDNFISDLESLNQINRGRHTGSTVRFEIHGFQKPLRKLVGDFTHYSPFVGSLIFGQDLSHEVKGIAKIQRRGKMIYSEVEFDSDLGHFRLELPHIPHSLAERDLRFMVDIGCRTQNLVG